MLIKSIKNTLKNPGLLLGFFLAGLWLFLSLTPIIAYYRSYPFGLFCSTINKTPPPDYHAFLMWSAAVFAAFLLINIFVVFPALYEGTDDVVSNGKTQKKWFLRGAKKRIKRYFPLHAGLLALVLAAAFGIYALHIFTALSLTAYIILDAIILSLVLTFSAIGSVSAYGEQSIKMGIKKAAEAGLKYFCKIHFQVVVSIALLLAVAIPYVSYALNESGDWLYALQLMWLGEYLNAYMGFALAFSALCALLTVTLLLQAAYGYEQIQSKDEK